MASTSGFGGRYHHSVVDDADPIGEHRLRVIVPRFGRALELNRARREHLVVEIKRPLITIDRTEMDQIENYAQAVINDARFDLETVQWDFVLSSDLANAALLALAPHRSTRVCRRAISVCWRAAILASRTSSRALAALYCEYVPLYSVTSPTSDSPGRSRCSTRVIDSSSSSRSWLMTMSAPR